MRLRDIAELVRLPAALTVPGDTLAGAAAAGRLGGRAAALPVASVSLYWAGMALNDWADRDLDAVERPERPIPSGRVRPRQALALAAGLTAAGVGTAAVAGGRAGLVTSLALAGTVWAYDTVLKETPAGPFAMASARGLDVLLGAAGAGDTRAGLAPAALLAGHTAGVTLLSRGEVHGTRPGVAAVAALGTAATAIAAGVPALGAPAGRTGAGGGRADDHFRHLGAPFLATRGTISGNSAVSGTLALLFAATVGRAQAAAAASPDAGTVRRATGAGIRGMIPLQAALVARRSPAAALGLLAAGPLAKAASKVVSPT